MAKRLIHLVERKDLISDYRATWFRLYKNLYGGDSIITVEKIDSVNNRPIFDGKYISPDDCLVIYNGLREFESATFLSGCGYTIDALPEVFRICSHKPLLMRLLNTWNFPITKFTTIRQDHPNTIVYTFHGVEVYPDFNKVNRTHTNVIKGYSTWDDSQIEGYIVPYYLYEPLGVYKVIWQANNTFLCNTEETDGKSKLRAFGLKFTKANLKTLRNLPKLEVNSPFIKQVSKAIRRLGIVVTDVLVGIDKGNNHKPTIIDINSSHYPQSPSIIGYDLYNMLQRERFLEFMDIGRKYE